MSSLQLPATDGASRLLLRLANRQQQALSAFQDSVRKFNKQLDEQQTQQLVLLQGFLQQSHKDTSRLLQEELTRVEDHQQQLTRYAETHNDNPKEGIVLEPFTDRYHTEEAHFNGGAASMQADRQRLIEMAITLQDSYEARVKAIDKCNDAMNASEEQRCVWMKRALFDLVVALAQIGYTGVSASQVMAQRVIHATNESLCRNHAAYKSLLLQLKSREILSQRMYCRQMAEIYDRVMQLMASSSIAWAVTLLQTAHFRRPDFRHLLLQRVSGIVSDMRHDGSEFLQNIGFTLQSLQRSRDPLPTECGQICGGTTHDGWLRGFDGNLFSPVFVPSAPGDVAAEWRVKANILVRHAVAQSSKLLQELRKAEENLRDTVENVQAQLQHILHWLCETDKPVNETSAWAKASMYEVDSVYLPFTKPNAARLNKYMEEVGTRLHPLSQIIHAESEWFVSVVDDALNRSYTSLECLLLTDHRSVLYTFDHATSALSNTVTGALGFIRDRLVVQYEAHKDHEDEVRFVEEELARAQQRIRSAETEEEAEKMFTHGLKTLEQLSNLYKTFHRDRVKSLQQLEEEGVAETEKQCTVLLRLFGLESEEVCLRRLEEERAAAAAAIAASATKSRGKETKEIVETDEEIDDVDLSVYPTVIADDGTPYLIVSPLMLGAESVVKVLQSECRRYLRCFGIAVPDDLEKLKKMYVEGIENEDEDEDGTNGGKKRGAATHKKDKKQGGKNAKKKANQKKAKQADGTEKESGKGENGQKEGDPDSEQNVLMRVAAMLWSVDDGIVQAKKALDANLEQHIRQLEELKNTYNTTFKQNVGELQMLANLQDISARFKAHVHSALALCDTNEAKLLGMLTELEEKLKAAPEVYDFSNLRRITSREHVEKAAMATPAGRSFAPSPSNDCVNDSISKDANAAAFSEDRLHMAEAELRERLADAMVEVQHEVRTSEAAHILRLLDKIRTAFYVRGRTLDCMQYGVEFLSIPQENYVEPRTTSPNEGTIDEMISSRGCPTPSTSRPSRRSRVSNAQPPENTSPYSTIELPAVVTLETQVRELMESAMSCACTLVEQHFASFPSPMRSRAPGMFSGTAEEITQAFDQLCEQQLQRTQQHLKQATRRYREHVQRLATAIKKVPNRVAASTFSLSCVALEKRVSAVLDVFARLYGESMSLRNMYENLVKATFASNRNRKRLNQVCTAEEVRQSVTQEVIDRFWKLSMREMEEETNMHLARSLNVKDCFFALLRGLVGPDHLKVQENDVSHRGLRRLMQLKAKEAREKELQQQVSPRRERRLRETMQRQRHSEGSAEGGDGKKGEGPLDTTKGILPLLVQRESEQGSVCVSNFHPIDQGHLRCSPTFNMRPTNNHHSQGSQLAFSLPRRHSRVTGCEQQQQASPKTTITISGPTTAAHKETAKVTLQSIDAFGRNITEAAEKMNDAFLEWLEREQVWKSTWEAAIGIFDA
uniref:DUF4456 domain-containing protein n=1 Tax=Trypanosoma vivax (strain Y486) TaxID=1055687 RepID=G0TRD6_TRYVY|nr:conserved hypothetical protein, fragment [Trypanosoma vivax Y486]